MSLTTLAWLSMAAYTIHILEEFMLNWRDWARNILKLPVDWADFYVTNGVVIALGIAQAMMAAELPLAPLSFAALMIINTLFFHVAPVLVTRHFSPGVMSALLVMLPVGISFFWIAVREGHAGLGTCVAAFAIGALLMAYPVAMLRIRSKPMFRQA